MILSARIYMHVFRRRLLASLARVLFRDNPKVRYIPPKGYLANTILV